MVKVFLKNKSNCNKINNYMIFLNKTNATASEEDFR